jgi:methyl-accepting chemotaxis protein
LKTTFSTKLLLGFVLVSILSAVLSSSLDYFQWYQQIKPANYKTALSIAVALVSGFLFGYVYRLYLIRNIRNLEKATSVISQGDLRQKVAVTSEDELGMLGRTFNQMVDSLVETIREVKHVSDTIYDSAMNLSATSDQVNASTQEISHTVLNIAKGAEAQAQMGSRTNQVTRELAASIANVAQKAKVASDMALEMYDRATEGNQHTQQALQRITEAAAKIDNGSKMVQGFRERSLEINNAVRHITSIAQQTHLLALNATIEAARAGEHGRGFGVVAEEVRKLSHETKKLAEQISRLADTINMESQEVLNSMSDSNESASRGKAVVQLASRTLEDIVKTVQSSLNQIQEITGLTRDQTLIAAKVVQTIEEIARIAQENAAGTEEATAATKQQTEAMQELASSAQELSRTSDRLKSRISSFQY